MSDSRDISSENVTQYRKIEKYCNASQIVRTCAASVWNLTPFFAQISPMALSGWMVPISLLTAMTETSPVSGRIAASSCARSISPTELTGR